MIQSLFVGVMVLFSSAEEKTDSVNLRYLRSAGEKYVLESEVSQKKTPDGFRYVSVTHRGSVKMKLAIFMDAENRLKSAEIVLQTGKEKKTAAVSFAKKTAHFKIPGKEIKPITLDKEPAVVTTAPDWSDVLFLIRLYDLANGGKLEFAGICFHPVKMPRSFVFTVERLGKDAVQIPSGKLTLGRYRIHLRSGDYIVWADNTGKVYKLTYPNRPKGGVVLSGYEASMKSLP